MLPEGAPDRPRDLNRDRTRSWVVGAGRWMVATGALLLLFALFQLWGTGLIEAYAQRSLTDQLDLPAPTTGPSSAIDDREGGGASAPIGARPAVGGAAAAGSTAIDLAATMAPPAGPAALPTAAPVRPAFVPPPSEGAAVGRLELPTLGVTKTIVQGVRRETLRTGPGHYPSSALPGQRGNVAIAGHRTTHGAPFADLDRLAPDDEIWIDTEAGRFTYRVVGQAGADGAAAGHRIVDPAAVEVIADHGDDRLTLTACHPKFSARQRIVVSAVLVDRPPAAPAAQPTPAIDGFEAGASSVPAPEPSSPSPAEPASQGQGATPAGSDGLGDSLGWQQDQVDPTMRWAVVTALCLFAAWVVGRFGPTRLVYPAAAPVVAVPLALCFFHLERLLPAY